MTGRVRGVILDVDGTLVDSNDAHARAWVDALAEQRIEVSFSSVRPLIGMGGDKLLPEVARVSEGSELGRRVSARRSAIFAERYLPGLRAFPKTRELVLRMRGAGLKVVIASSAKREELSPLLELARVSDLVEGVTSSSDSAASKPDPDIVQAALALLDVAAAHVVMIGDTPYDIEAAAKAGIPTIAFRCGGQSDAALKGALATYDGPADLLARFTESALAAS